MPERQSGDHTARRWVEDRRALTGEVREHDQPVGSRRRGGSLLDELHERGTTCDVLEPRRHAARCRHAGGKRRRTRLHTGRRPKFRMRAIPPEYLDEEHRRAVHQHEVARMAYPRAERLGPGIHRARGNRRSPSKACRLGCRCRDVTNHLAGPGEPWQRQPEEEFLGPVVRPVTGLHVVQRVALARCVVIENVFTGEAGNDERTGVIPAADAVPDRRLLPADPQQLGADRLRRQRGAAALDDAVLAEPASELVDLGRGPHVDAVEDRRPQGPILAVANEQARPQPAHPDARDPALPCLRHELATQGDDVAPPGLLGVHLGPTRARQRHHVRPRRRRDDLTARRRQHGLAAGSPDVDT